VSHDVTEQKRAAEELSFKTALLEAQSETTIDGILVVDKAGKIVLSNKRFLSIFGIPEELLTAKGDRPALRYVTGHVTDPPGFLKRIEYLFEHPDEKSNDEIDLKDGRTIDRYSSPLIDSSGRHLGRIWYFRDISERKRAEGALRESESRLRLFVEQAPVAIAMFDRDMRYLAVSRRWLEDFRLNLRGVVGRRHYDLFPDVPERLKEVHRRCLAGAIERSEEDAIVHADGTTDWVRWEMHPWRQVTGEIGGAILFLETITRRKRAEKELAQERKLFQALMDAVPDTIYFQDTQCRFMRINKAQAKMLGVGDPREAIGKTDFDFFPADFAQACYEAEQKLLRSGEAIIDAEQKLTKADGQVQWLSSTEVPIRDDEGTMLGYVGISRDITERKRAEERLRRAEENFRSLVSNIPDVAWTLAADGRFAFISPNIEKVSGYTLEEVQAKGARFFFESVHPDDVVRVRSAVHALFKSGQAYDVECRVRRKTGEWIWVHDRALSTYEKAGVQYADGLLSEITERKRMEIELRQAQKLEAVGQLAAGIAHEINTPIQFVGDNIRFFQDAFRDLERLLMSYEELRREAAGRVDTELLEGLAQAERQTDWEYLKGEVPKALEQTLDGVSRVSRIVRAMKDFSHVGRGGEKAAADLNRALESTLVVARNELKYVADVETEFGDIPPVVCNLGDLNQVFLNLLVNAAHAVGDVVKGTGNRGRIRVRTCQEGNRVVVAINDTGAGIPEEIREKIFEPFFTTKEVGKGTGQGLTLARNVVVERHGGSLTFESEVGRGSTFFVRLPIGSSGADGQWEGRAIAAEKVALGQNE
jgi:two-component system, NtrC family, sensor kinase